MFPVMWKEIPSAGCRGRGHRVNMFKQFSFDKFISSSPRMSELMTDGEYNWTTEGEPCEGSTRGYLELATHYIPSENGSNYIFLHIENTKQHYTYLSSQN